MVLLPQRGGGHHLKVLLFLTPPLRHWKEEGFNLFSFVVITSRLNCIVVVFYFYGGTKSDDQFRLWKENNGF